MPENPYPRLTIRHGAWEEGFHEGYRRGHDDSTDSAYWTGYMEGKQDAYLDGYNDGEAAALDAGVGDYESGYADGWSDGVADYLEDENDGSVSYPSQDLYIVAMRVNHSGKTLLIQVQASTPEEAAEIAIGAYGHEPTGVAKLPNAPVNGRHSQLGQYLNKVQRVDTPRWELVDPAPQSSL